MQAGDLHPHLDAERRVEVGKRLVEQEDLGLAHDGAADGGALALAAGELLGLALEQRLDLQDAGGFGDAAGDLVGWRAGHAQTERQVLFHRHVRIKGVGLEDHRHLAFARRQAGDVAALDADRAGGDAFQSAHHAQERGFSAARRTDEDGELAGADREVDALDHLDRAEALAYALQTNVAHPLTAPMVIPCMK